MNILSPGKSNCMQTLPSSCSRPSELGKYRNEFVYASLIQAIARHMSDDGATPAASARSRITSYRILLCCVLLCSNSVCIFVNSMTVRTDLPCPAFFKILYVSSFLYTFSSVQCCCLYLLNHLISAFLFFFGP